MIQQWAMYNQYQHWPLREVLGNTKYRDTIKVEKKNEAIPVAPAASGRTAVYRFVEAGFGDEKNIT